MDRKSSVVGHSTRWSVDLVNGWRRNRLCGEAWGKAKQNYFIPQYLTGKLVLL